MPLSYWSSETRSKKARRQFFRALLASLAALLMQISSVVTRISGKGVRRAGREYMDKNF